MKLKISVMLLLIISTGFLYAQTAGPDEKEQTVEELFMQNIEVRIVREQANSDDRDAKLLALDTISTMIEDDKVSEGDLAVHSVLDDLTEEGTTHLVIENKRVINYFPEVRRRACEVLAQLGGEESAETLRRVLLTDNEPMVKSEAAYSLGMIGLNEDNNASEAIAFALVNQDGADPDNNFAMACCFAFEKLAEANDGLTDSAAFDALILVAQGNYIPEVRKKAHQVLKSLGSY